MRSVLVTGYWIWLGVSLVVLVRRRLVGRRGGASSPAPLEATPAPTPPTPTRRSSSPAEDRDLPRVPSPAPSDGEVPPQPGAAATLGEAVAGIVLPSELVPRVPALSAPSEDDRVLLGAEAGVAVELAGQLADALVDLGYEPDGGDEISRRLHRRGTSLRVTVVEPTDPLRARAPGRVTLELSLDAAPAP